MICIKVFWHYDQEKFLKLGADSNAKKTVFHKTTVDEARSALHAEMEGHIENPQRLDQSFTKSVDIDFKVDGPYPFTHVDIKHPVGSEILQKQTSPMDLETMAYKMGGKLVYQKKRFSKNIVLKEPKMRVGQKEFYF